MEVGAQEAKKGLRDTVRRTKRKYWEDQIANAKGDQDLYRITGWHKINDRFRSPPITDQGRAVTNPCEKAELLRKQDPVRLYCGAGY